MPRDRDDRYDDDDEDDDRPRRRSRRDDDDEDDDRPRRRSRRDDDYDDYTPPKSNTGKTLLIVFGIVGAVLLVCGGGLFALLFPAIQRVKESAGRMSVSNNGKQIALAGHDVHDRSGWLPPPFVNTDAVGMPFDPPVNPNDRLSWRVGLLPYLEEDNLYRRFQLREGWNSAANQSLASTPVKPYTDPLDAPNPDTRYRCFYDNGAVFSSDPKARTTFVNITDGASNTLMYVESADQVRWTAFNDFKFDPNGAAPALGHPSRDTFMAVMCDGSIRWVKKTVNPQTLKAAITKAGAEPLGADW